MDLGITHLGLECIALEETENFYNSLFSFKTIHKREDVIWLVDTSSGFVLVFIKSKKVNPIVGDNHIGIALNSREKVDNISRLAQKNGFLIDGPIDSPSPVGYWACLKDPSGHTVEISFGQNIDKEKQDKI